MKPSAALANIQQISGLDCSARTSLPELAEALRAYVPFDTGSFAWMDERGERPVDMWQNRPFTSKAETEAAHTYFVKYFNREDQGGLTPTYKLMNGAQFFENSARAGNSFIESELHHLCLRPADGGHMIRLAVRDGRRPVCLIILQRSLSERPFSREDEQRLAGIESYLAHALVKTGGQGQGPLLPDSETGQIILDPRGSIQHVTLEAEQLLRLAAVPRVLPAELDRPWHRRAEQWLMPLVRRMHRGGGQTGARPAPHLQVQNEWGHFSARGYWLTGHGSASGPLISVILTRRVPLPLRLIALPAIGALPRREKEVCLLLVQGHTIPEIAERLGISPHTTVGHVTSLYARFEVTSREQLMVKVLTAG